MQRAILLIMLVIAGLCGAILYILIDRQGQMILVPTMIEMTEDRDLDMQEIFDIGGTEGPQHWSLN